MEIRQDRETCMTFPVQVWSERADVDLTASPHQSTLDSCGAMETGFHGASDTNFRRAHDVDHHSRTTSPSLSRCPIHVIAPWRLYCDSYLPRPPALPVASHLSRSTIKILLSSWRWISVIRGPDVFPQPTPLLVLLSKCVLKMRPGWFLGSQGDEG